MKKDILQMLKLGLVLAAFAAVACVLLALVNNVTSPKIAQIKIDNRNAALAEIFGNDASFTEYDGFVKEKINGIELEGIYIVKDSAGQLIGIAVQATGPTYDKSTILTGISNDRTIKAIKILACSDTSGFGQNSTKPEFYGQFAGKSIDDRFSAEKDGDIDGLSGATITRRGIANILKLSVAKAQEALETVKGSAK
ncbi:MAG: FMN-binding protein [Treponemataceae bacterium]|nr:FMN-binding protein [Treponemataceae bacterium]